MVGSVSMLVAFKADFGGETKIVLMDMADNTAYEISEVKPLPAEQAAELSEAFYSEQASLAPQVPYDEIRRLMDTEKKLATEGNKQIFRRY